MDWMTVKFIPSSVAQGFPSPLPKENMTKERKKGSQYFFFFFFVAAALAGWGRASVF